MYGFAVNDFSLVAFNEISNEDSENGGLRDTALMWA